MHILTLAMERAFDAVQLRVTCASAASEPPHPSADGVVNVGNEVQGRRLYDVSKRRYKGTRPTRAWLCPFESEGSTPKWITSGSGRSITGG